MSGFLVVAALIACAHGHGRTADPPNRASIWRFGYNSPANYDDDGLNCGGFYHQWSVNGGKCGVCGDPYDASQPRLHELGGKYGLGYIVATYSSGQVIPITTYLSASHLGYWEYRICPNPYNNNQECFDDYLLELEDGGTKYYPLDGSGMYQNNYRLPPGLECEHCVLQWKYVAGNNWGVCNDGSQGLGCGNQEHFFSCTDIEVTGILRLVMMANEIPDERHQKRPHSKQHNRHKRKDKPSKNKNRSKRRKTKRMPLY